MAVMGSRQIEAATSGVFLILFGISDGAIGRTKWVFWSSGIRTVHEEIKSALEQNEHTNNNYSFVEQDEHQTLDE